MWTKLHWTQGPWPGRIALAARPRGGDWIEDELARWRAQGVDVVCSLLMEDESAELDLADERRAAESAGMRFESFGIRDRDVPEYEPAFTSALRRLDTHLEAGRNVVIHCRQGVGRTGLVAAGLLFMNRIPAETAIQRLTAVRGETIPETPEQLSWLLEYARKFK